MKAKEISSTPLGDLSNHTRVARGGRGGLDGSRGRGRGTERGRGGRGRGAPSSINGARAKDNTDNSVPTIESSVWDTPANGDVPTRDTPKGSDGDSWSATAAGAVTTTATAAAKVTSSIIPDGVKKSWAR